MCVCVCVCVCVVWGAGGNHGPYFEKFNLNFYLSKFH